jgi:dihydrofolate reductase
MRKVVLTEFLSLDGVMEAPDQWHFPFWSDEMGQYKQDEMMATDALLLGRITYEGFAAAWPNYQDEDGFADRMNGVPKHVVSTTLKNPEWNNSHVIRENVVAEINKLKEGDGGDILLCGSAALAQTLLDDDVIDEYRLMVHPVVVGKGKRIFGDREAVKNLDLVKTEPLPNGVIVLTYAPSKAVAEGDEHPYEAQPAQEA